MPWQSNNQGKLIVRAFFACYLHRFVLLLLAINAAILCKILVKIGPVVSEEKILMENACMFTSWFDVFR